MIQVVRLQRVSAGDIYGVGIYVTDSYNELETGIFSISWGRNGAIMMYFDTVNERFLTILHSPRGQFCVIAPPAPEALADRMHAALRRGSGLWMATTPQDYEQYRRGTLHSRTTQRQLNLLQAAVDLVNARLPASPRSPMPDGGTPERVETTEVEWYEEDMNHYTDIN